MSEKYKRLAKLGNGAYGKAYLVQSKTTSLLWVIKKVDLNDLDFDERKKARDEARILEVLTHPNIIKFKDVFKDSRLFLNVVMEYADDGELEQKIRSRRRSNQYFTEEEILNYFT